MGQKEQGVILMGGRLAGLQRVTFAQSRLVQKLHPYLEALRVVRHAMVILEMDYYNSLYMELPLNAILKASTHATIAAVLATISGGILLVVT